MTMRRGKTFLNTLRTACAILIRDAVPDSRCTLTSLHHSVWMLDAGVKAVYVALFCPHVTDITRNLQA